MPLKDLRKLALLCARSPKESRTKRTPRNFVLFALQAAAIRHMSSIRVSKLLQIGIRAVDNIVDDPNWPLDDKLWHLDHVSKLLDVLDSRTGGDYLTATVYDIWIVACVREAEQIGRPIVLEQLTKAWGLYLVDAERQLRGETFPTTESAAGMDEANCIAGAIVAHLQGVEWEDALEFSWLFIPSLHLVDLSTFLEDMVGGESHAPREGLEGAGVDLDKLSSLRSWEELEDYPEFMAWYSGAVAETISAWRASEEQLPLYFRKVPVRLRVLMRIATKRVLGVERLIRALEERTNMRR